MLSIDQMINIILILVEGGAWNAFILSHVFLTISIVNESTSLREMFIKLLDGNPIRIDCEKLND
ncbi:Hypothetical protein ETEE_2618 [Edwardsiella anguillarum ET080813]|uniref:Uncharacterized protein n=1 Tax=Edwardsiella anguillarum ET080813 TaxID=667120 RepID=A0A076LU32_9GAMM|nr:Hypothetical protein ETEE_2618 [Edwardsiella anguillarum ET080813]